PRSRRAMTRRGSGSAAARAGRGARRALSRDILVTGDLCFQSSGDRGKQHLHGLIGDDFAGVVGSDRFSAYNSLEPERRQVCWSHLRRDFTFHADLGLGSQETFGLDGLEVTWNVFQAWKLFQHNDDRDALRRRVEAIKDQMWPLLEWGSTGKRQRHVRALAKNLLK